MFRLTTTKLSSESVYIRLGFLLMLSLPILAAYFIGYTEYESPFSCVILAFTGIPCPGCGLTRSFLTLVQGDIWHSLSHHLFGPFLFILLIFVTIHLSLEIATKKVVKTQYLKVLQNKNTQYLLLFSLFVYYSGRLFLLYNSGNLVESFESSPLADLIYN